MTTHEKKTQPEDCSDKNLYLRSIFYALGFDKEDITNYLYKVYSSEDFFKLQNKERTKEYNIYLIANGLRAKFFIRNLLVESILAAKIEPKLFDDINQNTKKAINAYFSERQEA